MKVEFLNPPELCPTFGWTHAVSVSGGRTIQVSGQVAVNERGEITGDFVPNPNFVETR